MVITDYRVQSVLRTYTRQLQRSNLAGKSGRNSGREARVEKISISDEGRRKHMMDRLTTQVFSKMYPKQDKEAGAFGKESEAENGPVTEVNQ